MLTRDEILGALQELGLELKNAGTQGEILLTGGAALCLVHEARDMTKDVDALYEPKEVINALIQKVATSRGLPADWLNDSVKGFLTANPPVDEFVVFDGLKVTAVSPEYLLAMKLVSARVNEKDLEDIGFLIRKLNLSSTDELYDLLAQFYPTQQILPKTMYVIEEFFQ